MVVEKRLSYSEARDQGLARVRTFRENQRSVHEFVESGLIQFTRRVDALKGESSREDIIPLIFGFEIGSKKKIEREIVSEEAQKMIEAESQTETYWESVIAQKRLKGLQLFDQAYQEYSSMKFSPSVAKYFHLGETQVDENKQRVKRFTTDVLIPFLIRDQSILTPTVSEVAGLMWGYQIGTSEEISAFDVGESLRQDFIGSTAVDRLSAPGLQTDLKDVLQKVERATPSIAARFWYSKSKDNNLL